MALTDKLSNIAEAIRTKTETTDKMTLTEMPDKILGIQTSEDLDAELTEQQQLISELKTTLENKAAGGVTINNQDKTITENGTYTADSGYTGLGTVTVDVVPPPSDIDALIDRSITEVSSNVTAVGDYAFSRCKNLASVNFPFVYKLGSFAFANCINLTSVDFPKLQYGSASMFSTCKSLKEINLPMLLAADTSSFSSCSGLPKICLPAVGQIQQAAFDYCENLIEIDFPKVVNIATEAFQRSFYLTRVILRNSSVCTLKHKYAFRWCYHILGEVDATYNPDGLKDGYIYVPRALIEDYKVATNWSNFATQFRALEDYTVDGTTTGALDESKI